MSYILEALKKSQAERQLGSAPTISAVPVGAAPQAAGHASRRPAWIALAALVLAAALALLAWRLMAPAPKAVAPVAPVVVAQAPAAPPPPLAVVPSSSPPPLAVVPSSPPPPKPVAKAAPAKAAPPPATDDERLPLLREMPEAIQRTVPTLVFGGYMYSKNPADRLLLIDKALRHEGEEVAPGLVLEKLLPKAAVMNFNGYRYRVPY
jgi:general secretion pathway protein B